MEKQLHIKGTQEFLEINIPVIEGGFGDNNKVMLAKTIAEIHNVRLNDIQDLINEHLEEFEDGIEIIDLKNVASINSLFLENKLLSKMSIVKSKNIYLLSESGYIKYYSLLKNKDENILNEIMNNYFNTNKKIIGFIHNKEIRFREILRDVLKQLNINVQYQYPVLNYRIDIYIPSLNIAIEYDENNHKNYTYKEHEGRQLEIEKRLGYKFIRVTDGYTIGQAIGIILKDLKGMVV